MTVKQLQINKPRLLPIYLFFFLSKFSIYTPFFALFMHNIKSFDNNQILLLYSVFSLATFLSEVPSGMLADKFSEHRMLLIGSILLFLSTLMLAFGDFAVVFLGEIFFALSTSFFSGTDQSYFYKYYGLHKDYFQNKKISFQDFLGNGLSFSWLALALSALLGRYLSIFSSYLPFIGTAIINFVLIFNVLRMENIIVKRENNYLTIFTKSANHIFNSQNLKKWIIIGALTSSCIIIGYQMLLPYLNELNVASSDNGYLIFIITLFAFFSSRFQGIFRKTNISDLFIVLLSYLIIALLFLGYYFTNNFGAVLIISSIYRFTWGLITPYLINKTNSFINEETLRSTIISIQSLLSSASSAIVLMLLAKAPYTIKVNYVLLCLYVLFLMMLSLVYFKEELLNSFKKKRINNVIDLRIKKAKD